MTAERRVRSVLLGLTGMQIEGGMASVARCVARVLDEDVRAGRLDRVDRVVLHDRRPTRVAPHHGVERLAGGSRTRFVWQVWRTYRRHRHDLVFFDLYGVARALQLPLPGLPPPRTAIFTHYSEFVLGFGALRGRVIERASVLLANSEFSAGVLRDHLPQLELPLEVVHLCIDPELERSWTLLGEPDPAAPRDAHVVCAARMSTTEGGRKGHDTLIEAWPAVVESCPSAQLTIAGRGDDAGRLAEKVRRLGVASSVRFVGYLGAEALSELFRRAAVYAMPSMQEGFGLVFAEAMWHGLPCVGSTADASGEVIVDGRTGLLVPFGDARAVSRALTRLLGDAELRRRLGTAGFRRVRERFGYERFGAALRRALDLDR